MPDANQIESPERRRGRRRKDPEEQSQVSAGLTSQLGADRANPQPPPDTLQQDPSPSAEPDDAGRFEQVRQRAYEIYIKRAGSAGDEVADWLEAERQIDSERPR